MGGVVAVGEDGSRVQNTFGGSPAGAGDILGWAGNRKVGEGRMTILESEPDEFIRIKLEFLKPFKTTNTAEFSFQACRRSDVRDVGHVRQK